MGVDFVAMAEHTFDSVTIRDAQEILNSHAASLRKEFEVLDVMGKGTSQPSWRWREEQGVFDAEALWREGRSLDLAGPATCSIGFHRRLFTIDAARWSTFLADMAVQAAILRICESTVSALGGSKVIYLPDSHYCPSCALDLLDEDASLEDVVSFLKSECGPPAKELADISREFSDAEMEEFKRSCPEYEVPDGFRFVESDGYFVAPVPNATSGKK